MAYIGSEGKFKIGMATVAAMAVFLGAAPGQVSAGQEASFAERAGLQLESVRSFSALSDSNDETVSGSVRVAMPDGGAWQAGRSSDDASSWSGSGHAFGSGHHSRDDGASGSDGFRRHRFDDDGGFHRGKDDGFPSPVPEPSTWLALIVGLVALVGWRRMSAR